MNLPIWIDQFLDGIQAILLSFLIKLGPFAVALMPALFTGYAIYAVFAPIAGEGLALAFALVVSLAVETVGIVATHTTIDLYNGWRSGFIDGFKALIMAALVPFYVIGVSGTVLYAEGAFNPLVQALGVASPLLTVVVYIAVALARDLARIKQSQSDLEQSGFVREQAELAHKQDLERAKLEIERDLELKRIEEQGKVAKERARSKVELARIEIELAREQPIAEPVLAQASLTCPDCKRNGWKTIQALNAHKGHCKGVKVFNGQVTK